MNARQILKLIGLTGLLSAGPLSAAPGDAPVGEPRVYKTASGRDLTLYISKPQGWQSSDRRPAVVFYHGGGYVGGTPGQFSPQARYLASRGLVCVLAQYRFIEKQKKDPPLVCIQDGRSAFRWVRAHAGELGIDSNRIAAAGGSAGGHLAAHLGAIAALDDPADDLSVSAKPNALLLFNPVVNLGPDGTWGKERVGDRYKDYSPAHNLAAGHPPAIVFLGREDKLIPVSAIEKYRDDLRAAGVRAEACFYEGQGHSFFNREPYLSLTLLECDKFLAALGWLQGPPTLKVPEKAPASP